LLRLGTVLQAMKQLHSTQGGRAIERDVVLVWGDDPHIITGADILAALLDETGPEGSGV
jgi:hypothetical protein